MLLKKIDSKDVLIEKNSWAWILKKTHLANRGKTILTSLSY